jgi:hypothetical protein
MVGHPRDSLRGDQSVSQLNPVPSAKALTQPPVLPGPPSRPKAVPSKDQLKGELLAHVQLLKQRRCAEIAEGYIDGYVALNWMEWNGGSLQLTVTGDNVRRQLMFGLG